MNFQIGEISRFFHLPASIILQHFFLQRIDSILLVRPNCRAGDTQLQGSLLGGKFVLIEQLNDHALRLRQNGKALAELFPQPFFAEDLLHRERAALTAFLSAAERSS